MSESEVFRQIEQTIKESSKDDTASRLDIAESVENKHLEDLRFNGSDRSRCELPWDSPQEALIKEWVDICALRSRRHNSLAKKKKSMHNIVTTLATITPLITATLAIWFETDSLVVNIGVLLGGIFSGINGIFHFESVMSKHYDFSAKYEDFKREMISALTLPRKFRKPCDVTLKEYELKMNALTRNAPDL